jgi:hypothetical protein
MKYYSNLRFALEEKHKILDPKQGNEVIGNWLGIEAIKTRLGPCYRTCYIQHFYETGINYYSGYARLLAQRGYLKPKNKKEFASFKQVTLKYEDKEINENEIEKFLEKHPELLFVAYPKYNINNLEESEE